MHVKQNLTKRAKPVLRPNLFRAEEWLRLQKYPINLSCASSICIVMQPTFFGEGSRRNIIGKQFGAILNLQSISTKRNHIAGSSLLYRTWNNPTFQNISKTNRTSFRFLIPHPRAQSSAGLWWRGTALTTCRSNVPRWRLMWQAGSQEAEVNPAGLGQRCTFTGTAVRNGKWIKYLYITEATVVCLW